MKKLLLILGEKKKFASDSETLLWHVINRMSIPQNRCRLEYVYHSKPLSTISERRPFLYSRFCTLKTDLEQNVIVGFGWLPTEFLIGSGKPQFSGYVGCKWNIKPSCGAKAWITYDPAAAHFDPNIIVDITGVIVSAAKDAEIPIKINHSEPVYAWKI